MKALLKLAVVALMLQVTLESAAQFGSGGGGFGGGGMEGATTSQAGPLMVAKTPLTMIHSIPTALLEPIPIHSSQLRSQLEKTISIEDASTLGLSEAVTLLAEQSGVNIMLDHTGLEDEGITSDTEVDLKPRDKTLAASLGRICRQLNLDFTSFGEAIILTPDQQYVRGLDVVVYPIADLVSPHDPSIERIQKDADGLIQVIENSVSPDHWSITGGEGSISFFPKNLSLVVAQERHIHVKVQDCLARLRSVQPHAPRSPESKPDAATIKRTQRTRKPKYSTRSALAHTLHTTRISVDFNDTPLREAIHTVEKLVDASFEFNLTAMEDEGIGEDTPVSFHATKLSAATVLELLLSPLNCTWNSQDFGILITSEMDDSSRLQTQCHRVSDLTCVNDARSRYALFSESLIELIEYSIAPDSWTTVGGEGNLEYYAPTHTLVVSQSEKIQAEVEALLSALRTASDTLANILTAGGLSSSTDRHMAVIEHAKQLRTEAEEAKAFAEQLQMTVGQSSPENRRKKKQK